MQPYQLLEKRYAHFSKSKYAVSCNSGTAALHLALLAIGVKEGDEVIIPDFTMAACGFAVSYTGATPVFVDCDDRLCIDVKQIEPKITPKTKAIMPVHIYGRLCDMNSIIKIAKKHHLKVIEDACEAQGSVKNSKADITCYSFYKNKIVHAEEGGICTTNNRKYADRMNYLKNMAFGKEHDYYHKEIGYNYRMPDMEAEMVLDSLKEVRNNLRERKKWEKHLEAFFPSGMPERDVVWVYDYIGKPLKNKKCRPFFKPLSSFPMWGGKCQSPNALKYSQIGNYIIYE